MKAYGRCIPKYFILFVAIVNGIESIWQTGMLLRGWEHSVSPFTCGSGYSPKIGMVCWVTELGDPEEAKEILPACNTIVTLDFYLFDHVSNSIH